MTLEEKLAELEARKQKMLEDIEKEIQLKYLPCKQCGQEYKPKTVRQMFCSMSCRSKYNNALKAKPSKTQTKYTKTCPKCGMQHEHVKGWKHGKFCSRRCLDRHKHGITAGIKEWFICPDCRKSVPKTHGNQKRCNHCQEVAMREARRTNCNRYYHGENHEAIRQRATELQRERRALAKAQ